MASGGNDSGEFGLQIAPMLDVMFVLLLFFMVSAGSQQRETELSARIPSRSQTRTPGTPTPITVKIDRAGAVTFNDAPVADAQDLDLKKLINKLDVAVTEFDPKQPVVIIPARTTRHARVVDVLNACSAAKVRNISFGGQLQ